MKGKKKAIQQQLPPENLTNSQIEVEPNGIGFGIGAIKIKSFWHIDGQNLPEPLVLDFSPTLNYFVAHDLTHIKLQVNLKTSVNKSDPKIELAELEVEIIIRTRGLEGSVQDGVLKLPDEFWRTLGGIAFGTIRGIYFAKLQGTSFGHIVMPAFPVNDMVPKEEFHIPSKPNEVIETGE